MASRNPDAARGRRAVDLHTFALTGVVPDAVVETSRFFRTSDRASVVALLMEEAGRPWAHAFECGCEVDEPEARKKALFDLVWHRRARELNPMVTARSFAGFDVLLDAARQLAPDLAMLLEGIDPNAPTNPRRSDGPEWWRCWHDANATLAGGWLSVEEVRDVWARWPLLMTPDVEQACLEAMGATYTHSGCWALLNDLGGFFAQCASEGRAALAEVDA